MKKLILLFLISLPTFINSQNVGINNIDPQAALDLKGDLRLRTADLKLPATINHNVLLDEYGNGVVYHFIGDALTSGGEITGFQADKDGRIITIFNNCPTANIVLHDESNPLSLGSDKKYRILTGTGDSAVIYRNGSVTLRYDGGKERWTIISSNNTTGLDANPSPWTLNGNNISNSNGGNVGIGTTSPSQTLEINGEIKLGNTNTAPQSGTVRWNASSNDFEGYDGTQWRSFTKSSSAWGNQPILDGIEDQKLTAADGAAADRFGRSVSIHGDYAIVGAYEDDIGANSNQGSAYIFKRSGTTWVQEAKLIASDGADGDRFGNSVSIHGDYAIVGAFSDDIGANNAQGSAYIFHRSGTTWVQKAKLTAADGVSTDYFGLSVSISGDYAIVGADNAGSAYIFKRSGATWSQEAKLTVSNGAFAQFGYSVSIHGDYAIVGADEDDIGANNAQGSAYIFKWSGTTWAQEAKLTAGDGASNDNFGFSVSIHGDYVIVGALFDAIGANSNQGSAYIFHRSGTTWALDAKLTAGDGASGYTFPFFGVSVSIHGNYAIVGAYENDIGANNFQGSSYIFLKN